MLIMLAPAAPLPERSTTDLPPTHKRSRSYCANLHVGRQFLQRFIQVIDICNTMAIDTHRKYNP
jgi:hypothetical protein